MAVINEQQTPLPVPPTGIDTTITDHHFNPESGHYEPLLKNLPLNANLLAPALAANFIAALSVVTLAEPGGNTLIVTVPANETVILRSTPDAPIFVSRTVGNITLVATVATVQVTATYTNK
jgi:hypothetical protein